ncbi:hypothetical protein IAD21_05618 [Abditibacteriota bacterium]|nr:hypothetical protein IAD21_05618 [Abditibacteriota bacterium]
MKTRSFLRTSLALGVFAITSVLYAPAFARVPQVAQLTAAPVTKAKAQRDYIKALPGVGGTIGAAQTAIRHFTPLHGNGPSVYLVAAIHIGEKSYYQHLQHFLDKQSVVLYEGVRRSRSAAKTKPVRATRPHASRSAKPPVSLYQKFSNALNLQFQLDGIHYDRPQFHNSDLDWDTLNALATKAGPDTQKLLAQLKNSVSGGPGITQDEQIVDKVLMLSASTPLVATILRRLLVLGLCEPDKIRGMIGLKPETSSTPDSAKKLDSIVINERNKAVLADLKALLKRSKQNAPTSIRSIAVFYGAAHMKDIEQHLVSDLGYRSAETQWITAIEAC